MNQQKSYLVIELNCYKLGGEGIFQALYMRKRSNDTWRWVHGEGLGRPECEESCSWSGTEEFVQREEVPIYFEL